MAIPSVALARPLLQQLIDAGIVPQLCQRVIMDLKYDAVVKIYYQGLGSEKLLELDIAANLGPDVKIIDANIAKNT
jgi:hypothetical protein